MIEKIINALNNHCDNSEQFHILTQEIAADVSSKFKCYCKTEPWGNYTYSNKIILFFNNNQPCLSKSDMFDRELYLLLSARGPFYTFMNYMKTNDKDLNGKPLWIIVDNDNLPKEILKNIKTITTVLRKYNMQFVNDKQMLEQVAEGHYTELDGAPASVYEILFGEII